MTTSIKAAAASAVADSINTAADTAKAEPLCGPFSRDVIEKIADGYDSIDPPLTISAEAMIGPATSFDHMCGMFLGLRRALQIEHQRGNIAGIDAYVPLLECVATHLLKLAPSGAAGSASGLPSARSE